MSCRAAQVALVASLALPLATARAFEPTPTHPGLTARAAVQSRLHHFLRAEWGAPLGLFEALHLRPGEVSRRQLRRLSRDLQRIGSIGGHRSGDRGTGLRAVSWCMAGSVLAHQPASLGRHHFFCPTNSSGLDDSGPLLEPLLSVLALLDGADTVRELFTGTGFALSGKPATAWVNADDNRLSVPVFYDELAHSVTGRTVDARRHHLALALLALGGVLHVLQDMASPTHVRNDFRVGHLEQLGSSSFNRGSAFERHVAQQYGHSGIPRYRGAPIARRTIHGFFSNKAWNGLADIAAISSFSPGTLPPPTLVLPNTDPRELRSRLSARLPFKKPALGPIDLRCAHAKRRCHMSGPHGPLAAYRIDEQHRLRFFLDRSSHAAAAHHLLPLAVGFSIGLIDHLLRGSVALEREGSDLVVKNLGAPIHKATGALLAEDAQGRRTHLSGLKLGVPANSDARLARLPFAPPSDAAALVVLIRGQGPQGDPLLATARLSLASPTKNAAPPEHHQSPQSPIGIERREGE